MKSKSIIYAATFFLSIFFLQCQTGLKKNSKVKLANDLDSASYYLGVFWGKQAYNYSIREVNFEAFEKGFKQGLAQDSLVPPDFAINEFLGKYTYAKYEEITREKNKDVIEKNEKYLEENKKNENVVSLSSGLQYTIITEGTGPRPAASDRVKVHYTGTLIDGTKFDSSVERGEPATFGVDGVIKGWTEALQLMPVGSKWKLVIPADLAYGANPPQGSPIPAFATLIFEVELLEIETNQ